MANGASAESIRHPCCRILAVSGISPPPIYATGDGFIILSEDGVCRVQATDRFTCAAHFGCFPKDLIKDSSAITTDVVLRDVEFKALEIADSRSAHPWICVALRWKRTLESTVTPAPTMSVRLLATGTKHVPPGVYLCRDDVVLSCCLVGHHYAAPRLQNLDLPLFGPGYYHALVVTPHATPGNFVSDRLFFAALSYKILMPYDVMTGTGKVLSAECDRDLVYGSKSVLWRQFQCKRDLVAECNQYLDCAEHCYIYEIGDKEFERALFHYLFGSAETLTLTPNPTNFVLQRGDKVFGHVV